MEERVVLVDENDREVGNEEKMKAHLDGGKLHRAFSIFVFNSKGETLIQKRANGKYHCPGLWSNTCCGHPRPGEELTSAAHRRLKEEMGFDCDFKEISSFIYKTGFDNGLTEWEFDHFFVGEYDGEVKANPNEAGEWKWIEMEELKKDIKENPQDYTYWFKMALDKLWS